MRYRAVLATGTPGSTLWLAPTTRAATEIRSRLLGGELDACFAPGLSTFARFAETVLQRSPRPVRPVSGLLKRDLVRQLVDEHVRQGRLNHFGPIASTGGLLDLLCDFIQQMKRLEIWPDQFAEACQQRGMTEKDRELLAIYRAYQQRLLDHDLYDAEGSFWSARDLLHRRPISHQLVVVDGFSDFTRTEHDILEDLAANAGEMWISLSMEGEEGRQDLFQKPQKTLAELRRRHAGLKVETIARRAEPDPQDNDRLKTYPTAGDDRLKTYPTWPAMAHVERMVFSNPRTMTTAPDTAGLEILAGGRQIGEIELIGRRIKRLLIEGDRTHRAPRDAYVRPGEIVVVFRNPQPLAELVSEVFQRLEIPFYLESGRPLSRSPAIVMLLRLLELDADDWPMHKLLGVLGNNYFDPDWADWNDRLAGLAERTIRSLQIPRGRQRLLERAGSRELGAGSGEQGAGSRERGAESGERSMSINCLLPDAFSPLPAPCSPLLQGLADALDQLPRLDTLAAYALAWTQLADRVGILRSMQDGADQAAWKQLHEALRESRQLATWLGQDAPRLDRKQAREALLDILGSQTLGGANEESGRVRVLSAASARHLRIPYLFLAGLSEKSFPAADREDGVYSQAEHQRLIDAGLPLPSRSERQTDEMLLFYETITAATRRLYLSYPAVDESGEPLTPSPYLKEVEQACGKTPITRSEQIDLSPVPGQDDVCSIDAFRIRAVADAMQGKAELLAGFVKYSNPKRQRGNDLAPSLTLRVTIGHEQFSAVEYLLRGLEFSLARQNRERFGAAEGMLGKTAAKRLDADFPPERIFSATELERYAYCPYQFFLNKVLDVQPLDDVELEVDYMQRGQMAHELLAAFHRRVNQAGGGAASPVALDPTDYERLLAEAVAETLSRPGADSLADALREIDRRKLLEWFQSYRQQHEKYDALWKNCDRPPRPELFEVSFGRPLREGDGPPSTTEPLELVSHEQVVRLAGRIDRIDVGEVHGQAIFNILDYKTGGGTRFSLEACQRGTALQLPLYALAASELILNVRDALPWQAGYWYVSGDGFKPRQALRMYELVDNYLSPSETWEAIRGILSDTVVGLVKAMRQGQFPVWSDDPDCTGRCPYSTVCRINQIRSLEKTWAPPGP